MWRPAKKSLNQQLSRVHCLVQSSKKNSRPESEIHYADRSQIVKQSTACCFSCPAHGDPIPDPRDSPSDPETSRTVWTLDQGNRGGGTLPPLPLHCLTCTQHCCWSIEIIPDKLPGLKIGRPEINGSFLCGKICPKLLQHCSPPQQAMLAKKQSVVKFKKLPLSALLSKRIDHQASFPAKLYYTSFWD